MKEKKPTEILEAEHHFIVDGPQVVDATRRALERAGYRVNETG